MEKNSKGKTSELMIGDFVRITEPDDFHGYIGKVVNINGETGYITVHISDMHTHDVLCDDLQPISLTPEILEKNGFEKSNIQTTLMIDQQIPPCIKYGIQLGEYSGIYISFGLQDCPIYDIRSDYRLFQGACIYVHELQHALKLCGIEKEIVL